MSILAKLALFLSLVPVCAAAILAGLWLGGVLITHVSIETVAGAGLLLLSALVSARVVFGD